MPWIRRNKWHGSEWRILIGYIGDWLEIEATAVCFCALLWPAIDEIEDAAKRKVEFSAVEADAAASPSTLAFHTGSISVGRFFDHSVYFLDRPLTSTDRSLYVLSTLILHPQRPLHAGQASLPPNQWSACIV